jgi:hypothetical protein
MGISESDTLMDLTWEQQKKMTGFPSYQLASSPLHKISN